METSRREQVEALEALLHFNDKLIKNMKILSDELSGIRRSDTDQLLRSVIDAINWEIQIMNATMDLLNEDKVRVEKEAINEELTAFSKAYQHQNDLEMAIVLHRLAAVFEDLGMAAKEVVNADNLAVL